MENRKHKFFATNISYTGTLKIELKDKTFKTNCGEAFCVNANGTVVTNFVISDTMKGVAKLQLVANDSAGSTTASLKVKKKNLRTLSFKAQVAIKLLILNFCCSV